jgi:3-oxoacyl-[acyl-carrier-protein] synthase III
VRVYVGTALRECKLSGEEPYDAMELSIVDEGGVRVVEGVPDQSFMARVDDADRVIEMCFSGGVSCALLYASNLTAGFLDLSLGEAGAILQKLRNYGVRLAVVCPAGSVQFSSRFGEMVAEERLRNDFAVFETRHAAREWLGRLAAS